jgi:predicted amidohydrolase
VIAFWHLMGAFTVAVAQSIASPDDLPRAVERHLHLATLAAAHGAQLVLFPELSLTGYHRRFTRADALSPVEPRLHPLQRLADAQQLTVLAGAPLLSPAGLHIGTIAFRPGAAALTYFKQHLHEGEGVAFTAGRQAGTLALAPETVALAICADIGRAEHAQQAAGRGATIYAAGCLLTEDGYEGDAQLLQGYARAHHMAIMMANYGGLTDRWNAAGRSAIWSEAGQLITCAPARGEALILARRTDLDRPERGWKGELLLATG